VISSFTLAVDAWVEILACRARLRLPRLLAREPFLRRELTQEPQYSESTGSLDQLVRAFGRALRAQPGAPGCLPRSLALRRFLARHGHTSRLGLGLRKVAGLLDGHAWVESGGTIVSGEAPFVRSFSRLKIAGEGASSLARRIDG
jgi:Transglutaminase-like superfamily